MKRHFNKLLSLVLMLSLILLPFYGSIPVVSEASSEGQEGTANPAYTMTSLEGEDIVTTVTPGQPTIIVFGMTTCSNTQRTIKGLADSGKAADGSVRVIYAECNNNMGVKILFSVANLVNILEIQRMYGTLT